MKPKSLLSFYILPILCLALLSPAQSHANIISGDGDPGSPSSTSVMSTMNTQNPQGPDTSSTADNTTMDSGPNAMITSQTALTSSTFRTDDTFETFATFLTSGPQGADTFETSQASTFITDNTFITHNTFATDNPQDTGPNPGPATANTDRTDNPQDPGPNTSLTEMTATTPPNPPSVQITNSGARLANVRRAIVTFKVVPAISPRGVFGYSLSSVGSGSFVPLSTSVPFNGTSQQSHAKLGYVDSGSNRPESIFRVKITEGFRSSSASVKSIALNAKNPAADARENSSRSNSYVFDLEVFGKDSLIVDFLYEFLPHRDFGQTQTEGECLDIALTRIQVCDIVGDISTDRSLVRAGEQVNVNWAVTSVFHDIPLA